MSLIAALAALAIFEIGLLLGGRRAAWLTWAGGCLTVPFLPHAWLLYPEMAAAAVVAWTTKWLIDRDRSGAPAWIGRGALLALLPWLHTKYVVLLAPLAIVGAVRLMRRPRAAAMFGAPIALALAAWFGSFFVMYGVFDPQAAYGTYAAAFVRAANIPRGLAGLAIDQKFGLLTFAPVYLLMLVGAWRARRDRWHLAIAATAIVTIVLFAASTTRLYMWWGGASAPARFLVPVVPLFAVLLALAAGAVPRAWTVALGLSLAVSAVTVTAPSEQRLLSDPHGKSRLLDWVQGSAPLTEAWPTFTDPGSRTRITRAFQALVGRFDSSARDAVIRRGRERLLACYDDRLRAFDYASRRRADAAFVLARGSLTARRDAGEITGDPERLAGPFALAAGDYVVRVWFAGEAAPAFVHYHRGPALARAVPDGPGTSVQMPLVLPVDTPVVWVGVNDPAAAARVVAVDVVPQHLVARHSRVAIDPIAIDPIEGGGLIVYADRRSYPEGGVFWTRGRDAAKIYVAPGRATHVRLTLHVGPNAGTVAVTAGEERREVTLPAEGTTEISFPTDGSGRLLPFTVEASDSFVPAVTDPKSGDTRALGCQVRIQLS